MGPLTRLSLCVLHNYVFPCVSLFVCIYVCVWSPRTLYPHPGPLLTSGWVSPALVLGRFSAAVIGVGVWLKDSDGEGVSMPALTGFNAGSLPAVSAVPVFPASVSSDVGTRGGVL